MNTYNSIFCIIVACFLGLSGCGSPDKTTHSLQYSPTDRVETVFQKERIPASCRVFAHLFVNMPAGYTGEQFVTAVEEEAKAKGADMLLIGHSRQCTTETDLVFKYYGPDREYKITEWPAWSYGFDEWHEQGAWANIGFEEWGNSEIYYDYPILMQVVFLRCR